MKLQLILAGPYETCLNTRKIWTNACDKHGLKLEVTDLESEAGQKLEAELNIKSFPALLVNNQVKAVGHPDSSAATELINNLIQQQHSQQ